MSHFYASIQGNCGPATRGGSASSGITGHVRGWNSGIQVHGGRAGEEDSFVVYATSGSNGGGNSRILGELKNGQWFPADNSKEEG